MTLSQVRYRRQAEAPARAAAASGKPLFRAEITHAMLLDMASGWRYRESLRPATLGSSLAAGVRLIVTCGACRHMAEPELADLVARHGAGLSLIVWSSRLVCLRCRSHAAEFVVSGTKGNSGKSL